MSTRVLASLRVSTATYLDIKGRIDAINQDGYYSNMFLSNGAISMDGIAIEKEDRSLNIIRRVDAVGPTVQSGPPEQGCTGTFICRVPIHGWSNRSQSHEIRGYRWTELVWDDEAFGNTWMVYCGGGTAKSTERYEPSDITHHFASPERV